MSQTSTFPHRKNRILPPVSRAGRSGGQEGESEKDYDRSPNVEPCMATTRHTVCPNTQKEIAPHQQIRGIQGDTCTEHGFPLNTVTSGAKRVSEMIDDGLSTYRCSPKIRRCLCPTALAHQENCIGNGLNITHLHFILHRSVSPDHSLAGLPPSDVMIVA